VQIPVVAAAPITVTALFMVLFGASSAPDCQQALSGPVRGSPKGGVVAGHAVGEAALTGEARKNTQACAAETMRKGLHQRVLVRWSFLRMSLPLIEQGRIQGPLFGIGLMGHR
jgi:hypothetical protein